MSKFTIPIYENVNPSDTTRCLGISKTFPLSDILSDALEAEVTPVLPVLARPVLGNTGAERKSYMSTLLLRFSRKPFRTGKILVPRTIITTL